MVVSSVVSAAPNPTVAAYAASKSYLTRCGGGDALRSVAVQFSRRRPGGCIALRQPTCQAFQVLFALSVVVCSPRLRSTQVLPLRRSLPGSFAEALHSELEVSGVGVTCVMPGATRTSFQDNSGSAGALVWQLPLFSMEAEEVRVPVDTGVCWAGCDAGFEQRTVVVPLYCR